MKKITITLAALALGASLVLAGPGEGSHRKGHHIAAKLNLTDVQKDQMRQLRETFRTENEALLTTMRDTRIQLREARRTGNTALAATLAATAEEQRAELRLKRQEMHESTQQILTPEQREKLDAMKAQRGERSKERRERRR